MASFDIAGARKAGYSDAEIAQFLGAQSNFDVDGARKAGYSDVEILGRLVPAEREPTALDRASAVSTGVNRGALTRTLGLPVDTVQNVIDLAKGGYGTIVTAAGHPDLAPTINPDRSWIIGSGDWLEKKVRDAGGGVFIDPSGPKDKTSRVLHGAGMGLGGAAAGGRMVPIPLTAAGQAGNALLSVAGGAAGTYAAESGASPALSILASMTPQAATSGASSLAKTAVRGGEQGRQNMQQRIQDFKEGGVENPSVGLASGNRLVQGVENVLANAPGAVGVMQSARERMISGMQNKTASARDAASQNYGADVAGRAIQGDLMSLLKPRVVDGYERVNNRLLTLIDPEQRFPIDNSISALASATSVNPAAPATTGSLVQPRINALQRNMLADSTSPVAPGPFQSVGVSAPPPVNQGLPVSALREIRSGIGREAASNAIIGTPEQADFKSVYGGLSQDIRNAARTTDMDAGPQPNNRGPAERTFDRGNALYRAGMERIERVQPFVNKDAPEQAYNALVQSGKENVSTLRAVKKSVSPETRGAVAATYIDRLGRANPSNQNDLGDVWSPERFLTNWNTLAPKAKMEMFSGFKGAESVAKSMDQIAKAASMLRDSSKVWANPSGTGANLVAQGAIGATAFGALFNPSAAGVAAGGMAGANLIARILTHPKSVNWLAEATKIPEADTVAHLNRLVNMANESKDAQFKKDVAEYVQLLAE